MCFELEIPTIEEAFFVETINLKFFQYQKFLLKGMSALIIKLCQSKFFFLVPFYCVHNTSTDDELSLEIYLGLTKGTFTIYLAAISAIFLESVETISSSIKGFFSKFNSPSY